MRRRPLLRKDILQAEKDYFEFWKRYPGIKNPSDINCYEKYKFAMEIGWFRLRNMQSARKAGHEFTKLGSHSS